MALQKFRDKQKTIYWIVALFVIPSFMIFGYAQVFDYNPETSTIGVVDDKKYSAEEFTNFYQRIQAVNFGQQVYFTWDGRTPQKSGSEAMFNVLALRDKAVEHGIIVTDEEVATYIRGQFGYEGNDEKELEQLIENMLQQTSRLKSVYEYKIGVREWLLAKKFLNLLDNSIFFPSTFATRFNTMQNTTYTYGKLDITLADFSKEAKAEIEALSEEELKTKAKEFITQFQIRSYRRIFPFLWTDAKWKIEYITVPLKVEGLDPVITDKEIQAFYNDNATLYKDKDGKQQEFADAKEQVTKDYISGFRAQTANNTLGSEYDRFLHRMVLKGDNSDNIIQKVELEDISADARLAERGVTTGVSGSEALTAFEIADNEVFTGSGIQYMLASLDYQFQAAKEIDADNGNNEATQKILDDYSRTFRGVVMGQRETPFPSSGGLVSKIRLVEYEPGKERKLGGKDNDDLLASITEALIENRADEKAEQAAEAAIAELKENKREIDGREVTTEDAKFSTLTGNLQTIRTTAIGETFGPIVNEESTGYSVYIVYAKNSDTSTLENDSEINTQMLSIYRGNSIYRPEFPMTPIIRVGVRLATYIDSQDKNIVLNK